MKTPNEHSLIMLGPVSFMFSVVMLSVNWFNIAVAVVVASECAGKCRAV